MNVIIDERLHEIYEKIGYKFVNKHYIRQGDSVLREAMYEWKNSEYEPKIILQLCVYK